VTIFGLRPSLAALALTGALALPMSSTVAAAPCTDPSGVCPNGGQVTFTQNPSPPTTVNVQNPNPPRNVTVQSPNPPRNVSAPNANPPRNVNVQNPNPPTNVNVQNPNPPTNVNVQNPNPPTNVNVQNPDAVDSGAQNPDVPTSGPTDLSVVVAPQAAGAGDTVAIAGRGFTANGRGGQLFVNLVDSNGQRFDTRYSEIQCTQTDDLGLNLLQDLGWGCSSGANGDIPTSGSDGTFRANIAVPAAAAPGPGQICISSIFSNPVCTPFMVGGGDGGTGSQ
jgi:hypothetical protein